jgi:cell division protein FtsW (lipid II flippase)
MTQVTADRRTDRYTAVSLHRDVRALHLPRLRWLNMAWLCVFAAIALSLIGIAAISTTEPGYAKKQAVLLILGLGSAATIAVPHYQWMRRLSYLLLFIGLALLIFVLVPIVPEVIVRPRNGARRWINLGFMDIQPSELAKLFYIFALAAYLRFRRNHRRLLGLFIPLVLTFIPMGLILIEPDLGTALVFLPTFFAMLIAAGARLKHIVLIVVFGLSAAPSMYPLLRPHQKERIQALMYQIKGDDRYIDSIGYQGYKAMTLVGAGGVTGVGREHARDLIHYNKLPEEHNDMVFAVVACRWGMLGALALWGLFGLLVTGGLLTAAVCREPFGRLIVVGITAVFFSQMTINTGMTIGLLPITGMTLPFVSYGGSSLVSAWLMIGVILNVGLRRERYFVTHEAFEFSDDEDLTR